jgi:3-oxoacyl-[acyl-carrier protein] reductase
VIGSENITPMGHILVFGATGSIGTAICKSFVADGYQVTAVSRRPIEENISDKCNWLEWDINTEKEYAFFGIPDQSVDSVVWAHGMNMNDSILDFNLSHHMQMYEANVASIIVSLETLVSKNLLAPNARLCIISSIWQNLARQNKLSYCVTKSALQGLVQSLAIDLGKNGVLVNAVLPGALDTPMTRNNLSAGQITRLEELTPTGSLPTLEDICGLIKFLCSSSNTGITGQFIKADRGFSHARII